MSAPLHVLFVCTGNICRSPTAEGVARALATQAGIAQRYQFDSAGTHGYHVGEPPDPRTVDTAMAHGYDLSDLRARRLTSADFFSFDHLLALDHEHLAIMRHRCPPEQMHKLALLLDFSPAHAGQGVPDPYYGGQQGFEAVLNLIETGIRALLASLTPTLPPSAYGNSH